MFVLLIVGLTLIGTGFGVGFIKFMDYDKVKLTEDRLETSLNEIEMKDNMVFSRMYEINYVIDDSINNVNNSSLLLYYFITSFPYKY